MKLGRFIPASEKWRHTPEAKAALNEGLAWAGGNSARATNLDQLEARVLAKRPARRAAKRKIAAGLAWCDWFGSGEHPHSVVAQVWRAISS